MSAAHQIRAADPALSVFVTANAGSGKTKTLVDRVARLLLAGTDPAAILCVTYTKAAAAEMQARLFAQLGGWAVLDDARLAEALAKLDDGAPAALDDAALRRARRLFARALETPGGLKIQTLHAFCEKLLRRFPIEAGVSPRFQVLENEAAIQLSHEAREDLAREAVKNPDGEIGRAYAHFAVELDWGRFQDLLAMIEAQREALKAYVDAWAAGNAPGPHDLAEAEPGVDPAAIEADFIAGLDPAAWAAAAQGLATGSANDQKMAARMRDCAPPATSMAAMHGLFFDSKGQPRAKFGTKSAPAFASAYLEAAQVDYLAALERSRAAKVADDTVKVLTLAVAHAALYEAAKARSGALDFTDLVSRTVALLKADQAAWVLYKLDGGIDHVLIDEAQDTAPPQWDIVRALTGEFFAADPMGRTVFAVGDEKQSIYSFQGARPERLHQEAQRYSALVTGAGAAFEGVELATSYRSTLEVLAFVDHVFAPAERTRAVVGERVAAMPPHQAARQGQHGSIDLIPLFIDEPSPDRDAWDDPVDQEGAGSARKRLARGLAERIRDEVLSGVGVYPKDRAEPRPAEWGDYLILVRRRDALFEEIIRALKTAGVPVAGADRLRLSDHILFQDLVALARFALFPDDDLTLAEVLRGPFCDVPDFDGADSLYALAGGKDRRGLWRELQARAEAQPAWRRARDLLATLIAARDGDPFAFFSTALNWVDDTGASGRARVLARLGREAEEAIDETLNQVLAAERRGGTDLETCLSLLETAEVEVKRELEGPRGEVRVMTVHGAKGLEAPVVILPDTTMKAKAMGPNLMPAALDEEGETEGWLMCPGRSGDDCPASAAARAARQARADAETLRLLYVALTRARDRIVVMGRASARKGPENGSWWSVIAETFDRLGEQARTIGDGVHRYGVDPVVLGRTVAVAPIAGGAPDWARRDPPVDAAARFASPSSLNGVKPTTPAPSPLARVGAGPAALGRFRRGDLIHRLLERLPDAAPADRPVLAERLLGKEVGLDADQRAEMIAAAFAVLDDARFAPVFGEGSRAEVALVGGAEALPPGVSVSGRIDRLVVAPDRVLVVDYKTNRPAPDRIEDADPAYVLQMAVYVAVLTRLYRDRPVEAALVWTDGPKLMPVPQAMMEAALETAG